MSHIPEGATHINPNSGIYYKMADDHAMYYGGRWDGWVKSSVYRGLDLFIGISPPDAPVDSTPTPRIAAHEFLERGVKHMRDRAVQRDSDAGERSMARAVAAFNAQEGTNLTEAQGWRFMIQLKYARAVNGVFVADDYEDMAAYAGLAGEAAQ